MVASSSCPFELSPFNKLDRGKLVRSMNLNPFEIYINGNWQAYISDLDDVSWASGDSFKIRDGRILIYSSIGVQNSIF